MNTIIVNPVRLIPIVEDLNDELSNSIYRCCNFCGKNKEISSKHNTINEKMSKTGFYCSFCLRHDLHTKLNKHTILLSFRGIFGYFYYEFYMQNRSMWLSEIKDLVASHMKIGLQNPVFAYDYDSMTWFVNFSKVGRTRKKIRVQEVLNTITNIIDCFELPEKINGLNMQHFYNKYETAIVSFYAKRYRPEERKILSPTLINCLGEQKTTEYFEKIRNFDFELLT